MRNSITPQAWQQAVRDLFGKAGTQPGDAVTTASGSGIADPPACDQLNAEITMDELADAFKRLKRNKAAGIDGIVAEFILDAQEVLMEPLQIIFNGILSR